MVRKENQQSRSLLSKAIIGIGVAFLVLTLVSFVSFFAFIVGVISSDGVPMETGNVAVIPVNGVIVVGDNGGFITEAESPSTTVVKWIEEANEDPSIEAIIFEINSPGGSPVGSDEIGQAIKASEKPTVAVIREVGASGGYWVASATDHIIANRMSITGSIGVIGSSLEFGGFLEDHNITYRRTVAGKYKDVGTPLRESTPEERALLQSTINVIYEEFVTEVAENRNLPKSRVRELATGYVFLGSEALRYNLIDELGGMNEAYDYLENQYNITASPVTYGRKANFFDLLSQVSSPLAFQVGRGIGSEITAVDDFEIRT